MVYSEEQYKNDKRRFGFLASLPILVAITHLLFTVFYMSIVTAHGDGTYGNVFLLGEMYASSALGPILIGQGGSETAVRSLPALLGVVIGLAMIFFSTSAVKGKKLPYYISFGVYLLDNVMLIPAILCSLLVTSSGIHYQIYDYFITILLHLIFDGLYLYGVFVIRRLEDYEVQRALEANKIHITKGE
jgi:hypothetical protein